MSRATASTAIILALLTGLVLGQLGSLATQPALFRANGSGPVDSPRALATVRAFYDGMNHLLDTGDRAIESAISPGFTEHVADGQTERTVSEMIDWLLATRATWPDLRVTVVALEHRDPMIVARLQVDPGESKVIPGVPRAAIEPGLVTEYLRIEGAGVTDRWSTSLGMPETTLTLQTDFSWTGSSLRMPGIVRIALEPGQSMLLPVAGPSVLHVELGAVQLDLAGKDLAGYWQSDRTAIEMGEGRLLETAEAVTAHNASSEPAELWVFTSDIGAVSQSTVTAAPRIAAFIPMLSESLPGASQHSSITRITLPPGATVVPHQVGGVETIAVVDGELEVTVEQGRAVLCTDGMSAHPFEEAITVSAGSGVGARGDTSINYRVIGASPATLLVMRIDSST